jgi:hypothetical protein
MKRQKTPTFTFEPDADVALLHLAEDRLADARHYIQCATKGLPAARTSLVIDILNAVFLNIPVLIAEVWNGDQQH